MPALRSYPALDVAWPSHPGEDGIGRLLAMLDDGSLAAVEDAPSGCRVFFHSSADRDVAIDVARNAAPEASVSAVDVSDEAWAERSQAGLRPITVDALTIAPPWCVPPAGSAPSQWIVIEPSMGFGTGHHQTTRLCLRLLQRSSVAKRDVLDVGTGSGVLAIAAARLGAASVVAVDYDRDAIGCAADNVTRNSAADVVSVRLEGVGAGPHDDWDSPSLTPAMIEQLTEEARQERSTRSEVPSAATYDLVLANLTGATLLRLADSLARSTRPGGDLIVSGFQHFEIDAVEAALNAVGFRTTERVREDEWMAMRLTATPTRSTVPSRQSPERPRP